MPKAASAVRGDMPSFSACCAFQAAVPLLSGASYNLAASPQSRSPVKGYRIPETLHCVARRKRRFWVACENGVSSGTGRPVDPFDENRDQFESDEHGHSYTRKTESLSAPEARKRLLHVLSTFINEEEHVQEVKALIVHLESFKATPITDAFTEMGMAGTWKLLFSSTRTPTKGKIRIRRIGQELDTENKLLINEALWSFPDKGGKGLIDATLTVRNSYTFVGPGRLEVELKNHTVKIASDVDSKDLPEDMKRVVHEMQLALPIEFFDPSGLLDISYMDPDFRLARFLGKRLAGVRNVFVRATEVV